MTEIAVGQTWRHRKTGGEYVIIDTHGVIQCSAFPLIELYNHEGWIVYRNVHGGPLCFRPRAEFLDERFGHADWINTKRVAIVVAEIVPEGK